MESFKHLSDLERLKIEDELRKRTSLSQIAVQTGRHPSTITREIKARAVESLKGAAGRVTNRCVRRLTCKKTQLCLDKPDCLKHCPACKLCNASCPDFNEEQCAQLKAPPYVCNGCGKEHTCVLKKRYYIHNPAHQNYRDILTQSRQGANITADELLELDTLLYPLIRNGQSVHHALANNPNRFNVHEKTVYRYVHGGLLHVKRGDMPRVCSLKPRRRKPVEHKVDKACRIGRSYEDFVAFRGQDPLARVVEMDTVIGRVGGKVLLTLHSRDTGFLFAFLLENKNAQGVIDAINHLWKKAGADLFKRVFPVLLTDNGTEFSNPSALAFDPDGVLRSHVFYCDPGASWQKGAVERNHEFLRMILPAGTSFDALTQDPINRALSHINSYTRPALNDKSPYDLFAFAYGEALLTALGIRRIPANQVVLKPSLLD